MSSKMSSEDHIDNDSFPLLCCFVSNWELFNVLTLISPTEIIDFNHLQFIKRHISNPVSRKCVIWLCSLYETSIRYTEILCCRHFNWIIVICFAWCVDISHVQDEAWSTHLWWWDRVHCWNIKYVFLCDQVVKKELLLFFFLLFFWMMA